MVRIGLTYTGSDLKHNNYAQWLKRDEAIDIVKLSADDDADLINTCDALVLSGGLDIHPSYYKGNAEYPHMPEEGFNPERDAYEFAVLKKAMDLSMPVLGICRGLQLINVYFDGTLVQHIPNNAESHMGGPDKKHTVDVVRDSLMDTITGVASSEVNSAHHQSIQELGNGLTANCYSPDGLIEGIEWADKTARSFMLAVQWHPERMNKFQLQDSPLSRNIRDHFIREIITNKKKK